MAALKLITEEKVKPLTEEGTLRVQATVAATKACYDKD
jgi:hypothetical protein